MPQKIVPYLGFLTAVSQATTNGNLVRAWQIDLLSLKPLKALESRLNRQEPTENPLAKNICAQGAKMDILCAVLIFNLSS